jgi:hypothetical protein
LPTLTASYSGFVNSDTAIESDDAAEPGDDGDGREQRGGGPYTITASGAVDTNYTIGYVSRSADG